MSMVNLKDRTQYALIDSLLDSYNENMILYGLFGDLCYRERAEHFMGTLQNYFAKKEELANQV